MSSTGGSVAGGLAKVPHGLTEIISVYGDIYAYIRSDGTIRPEWERHQMTVVALPAKLPLYSEETGLSVSNIRCHRLVATALMQALDRVYQQGLWKHLVEYDGCYNYRRARGAKKLSTHCWGIALDFNSTGNELGETPTMHPGVVEAFMRYGFEWGGTWQRPDGMHFQLCTGY